MVSRLSKITPLYGEALIYATLAHGEQIRKGTNIPYIHHPVAVSALVIEHGGTEAQAIAGLLHDVLEDCGAHHAVEIEARFGRNVREIVENLTDGVADSLGEKPPWRERKEQYLAHLTNLRGDAVLVSAADKLHNAIAIGEDYAEIGDEVFERFKPVKAETFWYYNALVSVFDTRLGSGHRLARRLRKATGEWAGLVSIAA